MNESCNANGYRIRLTAVSIFNKTTGEDEPCPDWLGSWPTECAFQTREQAEEHAKAVYGDPRYWRVRGVQRYSVGGAYY